MARWWIAVTLGVLGLAGPALAQNPYLPNQGRPTVMPDPLPYQGMPSSLPAKPMTAPGGAGGMPASLLPGPQEDCNAPPLLPGNLPTAWDDDAGDDSGSVYFSLGYIGLARSRLGHGAVSVFDAAGADTGDPPPPKSPQIGDFNELNPRLTSGTRVSLGYHCGTQAIEASGFYAGQSSSTKIFQQPFALDTFFNTNGTLNFPLGFEGDNGMWLQADVIRLQLQQTLGSAEVNYRWWLGVDSNFSWSIGVRYFDVYERLTFATGDDDLTVLDVNGLPDPTRQASYIVTTHNRILAPQLGLEWNKALNCNFAFTMNVKGAWGANFLDVDTLLKRGDAFEGFHGHRSQTIFSHMYELGLFLDIRLMDNARIRAGYDMIWAVDVAEALDQFDFNLANTAGRTDNHGNMFFSGPVVELHLLF